MTHNDANFIIRTDGDVQVAAPKNGKDFSLEELKAVVGGFIELVYLDNDYIMVVNEEGKLNNLPINDKATYIYHNHTHNIFDYIVGDVLVCKSNLIK